MAKVISKKNGKSQRAAEPKASVSANGVLFFEDTKALVKSDVFRDYLSKVSKIKLAG